MTKKTLKVCFIGIGSIAKRHMSNLTDIAQEKGMDLQIDVVRRGANRADIPGKIQISNLYTDIDAIGMYDGIFITNPTEYHMHTLEKVRGKAKAYFIEKPVNSVANLHLAEIDPYIDNPTCYVACPLRYKQVIQKLREIVQQSKVYGVRSISSSYLPEWRPGQDYRNTYSAQKSLGGGVSIDLIHEWDYLEYLFGMPENVTCMMSKKSNLEIDVEDTAIYLAEYPDKLVELHLDYYGRFTLRQCILFTEEDTIEADLVNNTIRYMKSGKVLSFPEERNDFSKAELRNFLEIVDGKPSDSTIRHGIRMLKLTQGELV